MWLAGPLETVPVGCRWHHDGVTRTLPGERAGARSLQAFLDESEPNRARDPHCYLLASAICDDGNVDRARSTMEGLRLRGQLKVHWRGESMMRRRRIVDAVAELPLRHLVVVRDGRPGERPERRRRHCLERMLFELDRLSVDTATFESRGPVDDRRDRSMLDALRARRVVSTQLRMAHTPGPKDALLWVPDVVCGAMAHQRTGNDEYLEMLRTRVQMVTIAST